MRRIFKKMFSTILYLCFISMLIAGIIVENTPVTVFASSPVELGTLQGNPEYFKLKDGLHKYNFNPVVDRDFFYNEGAQEIIFEYINQIREEAGLYPYEYDTEMDRGATIRAMEYAVQRSHTRPDGTHFATSSKKVKGENLGMMKPKNDPKKIVDLWMNSTAGHREAILGTKYKNIAIGAVVSDKNVYTYSIHFGLPVEK